MEVGLTALHLSRGVLNAPNGAKPRALLTTTHEGAIIFLIESFEVCFARGRMTDVKSSVKFYNSMFVWNVQQHYLCQLEISIVNVVVIFGIRLKLIARGEKVDSRDGKCFSHQNWLTFL